jgi:hypothetical protein
MPLPWSTMHAVWSHHIITTVTFYTTVITVNFCTFSIIVVPLAPVMIIYIWASLGGFKDTMLYHRLHPTQNKNTYLHDMFRFYIKSFSSALEKNLKQKL